MNEFVNKLISRESFAMIIMVLCIVCTTVIAIVCDLECSQVEVENERLQTKNEQLEAYIGELEQELGTEKVELDNCPKCKSTVELMQTMDFFHIKCSGCGLGTIGYESKDELVEYWNKE